MKPCSIIGLMSGTSLDGVDIAACEFTLHEEKWSWKIRHGHTYPYSPEWKSRLSQLPGSDALTFSLAHVEYGHLLGRLTHAFLIDTGFKPDLIASHGHTIFHQPERGLTVQIGLGSAIAAETGVPVVCDFRSADVCMGGQGAPLVPIGDRLLFGDYDACLNLGGFANISLERNGQRIAFDICPVNIALNQLANELGREYDHNGEIARSGKVDPLILNRLNQLDFYNQPGPKSLAREWLIKEFIPIINIYTGPEENMLRTICEHMAIQVNLALEGSFTHRVLVTGGGARNVFLMERIRQLGIHEWIHPRGELTDFKEALVFAFLGLLRWRREVNILNSVTGSRSDHAGGAIYDLGSG